MEEEGKEKEKQRIEEQEEEEKTDSEKDRGTGEIGKQTRVVVKGFKRDRRTETGRSSHANTQAGRQPEKLGDQEPHALLLLLPCLPSYTLLPFFKNAFVYRFLC